MAHNAFVQASAPLKQKAQELGFDMVGVCDATRAPHLDAYRAWLKKGYHGEMGYMERHAEVRGHPNQLLPGAKSIIVVGMNYNQPNEPRPGYPRIARYALGRDYHKVLRGKLAPLSAWIKNNHPHAERRICVDSAPIFERDYACQAGLGWFGKNTCLIDTRRGSWFVIGLLITTVRFQPDKQAVGGCGTCTRCVDACPTGAILFEEERWQIDARKCVSYQTIEVPALRDGGGDSEREAGEPGPPTPYPLPPTPSAWTFGCDVCQEVCPFNQPGESQPLRGQITKEPGFLAKRDWPNLAQLAQIDYEEWDALTRGSAVRRAGWQGLRRNAENSTA